MIVSVERFSFTWIALYFQFSMTCFVTDFQSPVCTLYNKSSGIRLYGHFHERIFPSFHDIRVGITYVPVSYRPTN